MTRGPLASDLLRSAAPARAGIGRSGIPNASSAANLPYRMHLARLAAACAAVIVLLPAMAAAQAQMPDPAMIHGRAIPAGELPDGRVTVRVVRESIGNDVPAQQVRVTVNGAATTATTDAEGRAEFPSLPKGMQGVAEVTVDGEALVSQPFTVPDSGGLRVILVAGMAEAAARKAKEAEAEAAQPPTKGTVVFGDNSRVLIQFADDGLQVYYILNVVNNARGRVDIGGPLLIDLPRGAAGASALEGSSPTATVTGSRITITGPFAAGTTPVQVAYRLRYDSGTFAFAQTWPAAFPQVTVGVQKVGALQMTSPQLALTNDVRTDDGTVFLLGSGPGLPAGGTLNLTLTNLPFHSQTPRRVALSLAIIFVIFGAWMAYSAGTTRAGAADRQGLIRRRDTLLRDLEEVETRRRAGTGNRERNDARRQHLLNELEQVYGALDDAAAGPQGGGEGVAA
jgi:hypothetical protein